MITALMTDIHGNREALDACLDHARSLRTDRTVFLGDYVGYGADPSYVVDTVAALAARGAVALLGNHDQAVSGSAETMNPAARAAIEWTRRSLDDQQRMFLRERPLTWQDGERLFVHANAVRPEGWGYIFEPIQAERSMLAARCRSTFCGHTHVPALFHMAASPPAYHFIPEPGTAIPLAPPRHWLAVIGSVGQPRDDDPRACYALLDDNCNTLTYVRVAYDIETAARKIRDAGLPESLAARLYRGH